MNPSSRYDIGVTGTRFGMTMPQRLAALDWFRAKRLEIPINGIHLHLGCCIGSDEEFALLAKFLGFWIVAHIPEKRDFMSDLAYTLSDFTHPARPYLIRNQNIVERSDEIIATPAGKKSRGTWYTIDYAIERHKKVTVIYPSGRMQILKQKLSLLPENVSFPHES